MGGCVRSAVRDGRVEVARGVARGELLGVCRDAVLVLGAHGGENVGVHAVLGCDARDGEAAVGSCQLVFELRGVGLGLVGCGLRVGLLLGERVVLLGLVGVGLAARLPLAGGLQQRVVLGLQRVVIALLGVLLRLHCLSCGGGGVLGHMAPFLRRAARRFRPCGHEKSRPAGRLDMKKAAPVRGPP